VAKIWLTTDTHFGHDKLVDWGRPNDFTDKTIKGYDTYIKPEDTLIHLGDYELGNPIDMSKWGRSRILIRGNHDRKSEGYYLDCGFTSVCNAMVLTKYGLNMYLTHIPRELWDSIDLCIHGHFHGNSHRMGEHEGFYGEKYYEVALEKTNYQPITLENAISNWKKEIIKLKQ
jgi:calcineurin-like phosphoesterase family protein